MEPYFVEVLKCVSRPVPQYSVQLRETKGVSSLLHRLFWTDPIQFEYYKNYWTWI